MSLFECFLLVSFLQVYRSLHESCVSSVGHDLRCVFYKFPGVFFVGLFSSFLGLFSNGVSSAGLLLRCIS